MRYPMRWMGAALAAALLAPAPAMALDAAPALAAPRAAALVLNEINSSPDDWVELMNTGDAPIDLSGYELRDNSDDHRWRFADGARIEPGALLVVDAKTEGLVFDDASQKFAPGTFEAAIGIGSGDSIRLYDAAGEQLESYSWTKHASHGGDAAKASYGRFPDGTGDFRLTKETKGAANARVAVPVVINEVQSNDPADGPDWVELANPTDEPIDISGIVMKDNSEKKPYTFPEGTTIEPRGFLVIKQDDAGATGFAYGLGKGDSVRLFDGEELIATTTWPDGSHTAPTWGLYPDVNGSEYRNTAEETPGAPNKFVAMPTAAPWPGASAVRVFDAAPTFLEDSSGLDFHDGKLYAVDNGTATFWVLDVAKDGGLTFAPGFERGRCVAFQKDAANPAAKGPDAEGITVDGDGMVYLASERDNAAKDVNFNSILMVDPATPGERLVAQREWDLTASLPQVSANMGIEAVEWVANAEVAGKLVDQNIGKAFDPAAYPNAVAAGVFFVALEDNGHAYAYVLNEDGTSVQVADIDSKLGGAMALDYDVYEHALWIKADNGYGNKAAKVELNGTDAPVVSHVAPAAGLDAAANYEGFAIASPDYTVDGQRPVYHFADGVTAGALAIGSMACDAKPEPQPEPDPQPNPQPEPENPGDGQSQGGQSQNGPGQQGQSGAANPAPAKPGSALPQTGDPVAVAVTTLAAAAIAAIGAGVKRSKLA